MSAFTLDAILARVAHEPNTGCWLWYGTRGDDYGRVRHEGRRVPVHRLVYETLRGPIPPGLVIDHLCRVRCCCNPDHLEPVTIGENVRRGMAPNMLLAHANVCARGHVLKAQSSGRRTCRECSKGRRAAWRAANPEKVHAQQAAWAAANNEHLRVSHRAWRESNPDKVIAKRKKYLTAHREAIRERQRMKRARKRVEAA